MNNFPGLCAGVFMVKNSFIRLLYAKQKILHGKKRKK